MVGLLPHRPQRGKTGLQNLERVAASFETLFATHCVDIEHGRVTGEKALQSHLIRNAQTNDGGLQAINAASQTTNEPVELVFVTDEISLPLETGNIVCDVLALRVDDGRSTPVLLELKDGRHLTRLVQQVDRYAALIDEHADLFAELYSALLGRVVRFDAPTAKWIVWPMAGADIDPSERELAARGVRLVGYEERAGTYGFRVGNPGE